MIAEPAVPKRTAERCASGELSRRTCRFKWRNALTQSATFLTLQHVGNIATYDKQLRGPFFRNWFESVGKYRFSRWSDDDPLLVDYVGHPMMGAVASRIYIQNDPKAADAELGRNRAYWKSRAKAMGFAAAYSVQWELGPASETSIGNLGREPYWSKTAHKMTNGTGMVDLVVTPVAGTALSIGEDAIDRYAIQRLEQVSRNRAWLMAVSVLNPTRGTANLLRLKAPWHRDTRRVR